MFSIDNYKNFCIYGSFRARSYSSYFYCQLAKNGGWLWDELVKNGSILCAELQQKSNMFQNYVYVHWGPSFCSARQWCQLRLHDFFEYASQLWDLSKPYINQCVSIVAHYAEVLVEKTKQHFPVFIDSLTENVNFMWTSASNSVGKLLGEN